MTFDVAFQGADFEVAIECPAALVWKALCQVSWELRRFIIQAGGIVLKAVLIAIDTVDVVGTNFPESC